MKEGIFGPHAESGHAFLLLPQSVSSHGRQGVHPDAGCDVGTLPSREALGPWGWRVQQQLQEIASNIADLYLLGGAAASPREGLPPWTQPCFRCPHRAPVLPYRCGVLLCTALPPEIHGKGGNSSFPARPWSNCCSFWLPGRNPLVPFPEG